MVERNLAKVDVVGSSPIIRLYKKGGARRVSPFLYTRLGLELGESWRSARCRGLALAGGKPSPLAANGNIGGNPRTCGLPTFPARPSAEGACRSFCQLRTAAGVDLACNAGARE